MQITRRVVRLDASMRGDFFRLHSETRDCGWCACVAWWVPTWEGWGERTAEENRRFREGLFDREEYDGYLLYEGEDVLGWCQVGPRDRLEKLRRQFDLSPDPDAWAITCFLIAPDRRRGGRARFLLQGILADLRARGVHHVEAFPKRGDALDDLDLWNGPESLFQSAGFEVVRDDRTRPVLSLHLE